MGSMRLWSSNTLRTWDLYGFVIKWRPVLHLIKEEFEQLWMKFHGFLPNWTFICSLEKDSNETLEGYTFSILYWTEWIHWKFCMVYTYVTIHCINVYMHCINVYMHFEKFILKKYKRLLLVFTVIGILVQYLMHRSSIYWKQRWCKAIECTGSGMRVTQQCWWKALAGIGNLCREISFFVCKKNMLCMILLVCMIAVLWNMCMLSSHALIYLKSGFLRLWTCAHQSCKIHTFVLFTQNVNNVSWWDHA